jgi:predicted TIM-barrel fold metal-dependent hydrolase
VSTGSPDTAERLKRWEHWLALCQEQALDSDTPIVDPHHHLWDRGGHTYLPQQFAADARSGGHDLVSSVYVECLWQYFGSGPAHLRPVGETAYVAGLAQPARGAGEEAIAAGIVAYADLSLADAVDEVLDAHEQAGSGRLRGVRYSTAYDADPAIHSAYQTHPNLLRESAVQEGAKRLARRGLSIDVWLYFHQLGDALALARACPDLTIVVDHAGGPIGLGPYAGRRSEVFEQWRTTLQALGAHDNIHLKFGGLAMPLAGFDWRKLPRPPGSVALASAWQPYWDVCLEVFGPQRCMFESNFPVDRSGCTYTALWNAFKRLAAPLTVAERQAVLAGTAQRVYRV